MAQCGFLLLKRTKLVLVCGVCFINTDVLEFLNPSDVDYTHTLNIYNVTETIGRFYLNQRSKIQLLTFWTKQAFKILTFHLLCFTSGSRNSTFDQLFMIFIFR